MLSVPSKDRVPHVCCSVSALSRCSNRQLAPGLFAQVVRVQIDTSTNAASILSLAAQKSSSSSSSKITAREQSFCAVAFSHEGAFLDAVCFRSEKLHQDTHHF